MPGVTKHIFNHEICDILSMFNCEIKTIEPLLPKEYSSGDIIALLKEFYPHEWHSVEIKYVYYQTKDRYIKRKFGKNRYNMKAPEVLLMDEPTSALDPISTSKIEELAAELKKDYTIVMVTHNMQQATRISDKTAFFLLGEVIEFDNTDKLFSMPSDKRTEDYITGRFG